MKKILYSLSIFLLFVCAGCGSDEPDDAGQIGCQAYLKDKNGVTDKVFGVFFLFEGTGYVSIDMSTYESMPIQKIQAVKSNGSKVENVGWCTSSKDNSGLIVPVYSATDKDRLERIQSGTFTIVCLVGYGLGYYEAYMMKEFTKKRSDPVRINPVFYYTDFSTSSLSKVSWRE